MDFVKQLLFESIDYLLRLRHLSPRSSKANINIKKNVGVKSLEKGNTLRLIKSKAYNKLYNNKIFKLSKMQSAITCAGVRSK